MKISKLIIFSICSISAALFSSCRNSEAKDRETLYQVNLLQSLMQGNYDGTCSIKDLKENGDIGIGTFDSINGELIALDGTVYQALYDGSVATPPDSTGIPFAAVSFFDPDISTEFSQVSDLNDLSSKITEIIDDEGKNSFYFIKISGLFNKIYCRSEVKQDKPYKPLAEALKTAQREFNYENISGTIVGLYCPSFMDNLNSVGYHFHFISADKTKGGHVFALTAENLKVQLDKTSNLKIELSETSDFQNLNLAKNMTKDIDAVERGK